MDTLFTITIRDACRQTLNVMHPPPPPLLSPIHGYSLPVWFRHVLTSAVVVARTLCSVSTAIQRPTLSVCADIYCAHNNYAIKWTCLQLCGCALHLTFVHIPNHDPLALHLMRCMFYRRFINQYCTERTQTRQAIIKLIVTLVHILMRCVQSRWCDQVGGAPYNLQGGNWMRSPVNCTHKTWVRNLFWCMPKSRAVSYRSLYR